MMTQALNHLWQSTAILCVAGALTLLLRKNSAAARYRLWFAASVKFLIPLSPLIALGSWAHPISLSPVLAAPASQLAQRVSEPFAEGPVPVALSAVTPMVGSPAISSTVAFMIWILGAIVVVLYRAIQWRRMHRTLSTAAPLALEASIPLYESPTLTEPGLVGIWNPAILLPTGLAHRLAPAELRSILAHEICHHRRRDNLTAIVHMLVEILFWFYPPIWWLGARMIDEREQACDEAVLNEGNDAQIYAETILKVCRFSSLPAPGFAAGVSGGVLSRRVEKIMSGGNYRPVGLAKTCVVTLSIGGALSALILLGELSVPTAHAQVSDSDAVRPSERQRLLEEQTRPQKEVPFNPTDFDKYAGYYQDRRGPFFFHIYRTGSRYFSRITGQQPVEVFPESSTEFFATVVAAQVSFVTDSDGSVTGLVLHQDGRLRPWDKVSAAEYAAADAKLKQRIKDNVPGPGTEAAIRHQIETLARGEPDYDSMTPALAEATREQLSQIKDLFGKLGPLNTLEFRKVLPNGVDMYLGTFAHGQLRCTISPLSSEGKVTGDFFHELP
jgi:beta-lactamase regulating signal transducer with metallopeptidase domain